MTHLHEEESSDCAGVARHVVISVTIRRMTVGQFGLSTERGAMSTVFLDSAILGSDLEKRKSNIRLGLGLDPDEPDHFMRREDADL